MLETGYMMQRQLVGIHRERMTQFHPAQIQNYPVSRSSLPGSSYTLRLVISSTCSSRMRFPDDELLSREAYFDDVLRLYVIDTVMGLVN
jgi:hypothetical protein